MSEYHDKLQLIAQLNKEKESWCTGSIIIPMAKSLDDDSIVDVDISPTLGHNKRANKEERSNDNCYWLPKFFNANTHMFRMTHIFPIVINACKNAGFKVRGKYIKAASKVRFSCCHGFIHQEQMNKKYVEAKYVKMNKVLQKSRKKKTQLPIPSSTPMDPSKLNTNRELLPPTKQPPNISSSITCKCSFSLFWDESKQRWYFPHLQSGCLKHTGHLQLQSKVIRLPLRHCIPENEKDLALDSHNCGNNTTSTLDILEERNDVNLSWQQVHYLKSKQRNRLVMNDDVSNPKLATPVDRLLMYLRSDPTKSFIAIFGEYASGLLTIKTKTWKQTSKSTAAFSHDLHDNTDSPVAFAQSMRNRLVDSNNGKLLLGIAWTTDACRRKFDMFPESTGGDDAEDTNNEKRPLHTLCAKDGFNQIFAFLWVFLPSAATWSYTWAYEFALPRLHPGTGCYRMRKLTTDSCRQITTAITSIVRSRQPNDHANNDHVLCRSSKVDPNFSQVEYGHCAWHVINRNFTHHQDYKAILAAEQKTNVNSRIEIAMLVRWMWYFVKYYQLKSEVVFSFSLMTYYLSEPDQADHFGVISQPACLKIKDFMTSKFYEKKDKIFSFSFTGTTLGQDTSSNNESEHAVYRKHTKGPRPNDPLDVSGEKITKITERKEQRKDTEVAFQMTAQFGKEEDRLRHVDGATEYASEKLWGEYDQVAQTFVYRKSEFEFYTKRDYTKNHLDIEDDLQMHIEKCDALLDRINDSLEDECVQTQKVINDICDKLLGTKRAKVLPEYSALLQFVSCNVIPRFERTRLVVVKPVKSGGYVMTCSCPYWRIYKRACRCMYKVLGREPILSDAHVRWHVGYAYHFGRDPVMTDHYMKLRDKIDLPGVPLTQSEWNLISSRTAIGTGDNDFSYFSRSLNRLYFRGTTSYWHNIAKTMTGNLKHQVMEACGFSDEEHKQMSNLDVAANINNNTFGGRFMDNDVEKNVSEYMVPSQTQCESEDDGKIIMHKRGEEGDKGDCYHKFMHLYERMCKSADSNGIVGSAAMRDCLNLGISAQYQLSTQGQKPTNSQLDPGTTFASLPEIGTQKKAKRKQKVTSPQKPTKKRRKY